MQDEVLATLQASTIRRWAGVGMLLTLGALVIYVALASPPEPFWQIFLFVVGGAAFWLAHRMWQATFDRIELTHSALRTGEGQVIAEIQDIEAIERGAFAFKPSNGFLVRTKSKGTNSWAPGLWWRLGHRVGVGGMTAAADAKFMSEMISAMLFEQKGH